MINIIAAVDENMGIGKDNKLLAHIEPDLRYFKKMTTGKIVVMGYNTYLSLPIKPLPNRTNVLITSKDIEIEGFIIFHSVEECKKWIDEQNEEVFIIGGRSIYEQFLPYTDRLYLTHIFHKFDADTFFPDLSEDWQMVSAFGKSENFKHKYKHIFAVYERK